MSHIRGFSLKRTTESHKRYETLLFINRLCKRYSKDLKKMHVETQMDVYKSRKYVHIKSNFVKKAWDKSQ